MTSEPEKEVTKPKIRSFKEWQEYARKAPKKWMIYGIEDKPKSLIETILLGLQQYFIMFGATVAVPMLVAGWIKQYYQIPDPVFRALVAELITIQFFGAGICTLLQTWPKTGSGLPIIQGSSFSFLGSLFAIISATGIIANVEGYSSVQQFIASTDPWLRATTILRYTTGAIIGASFFEIILGYAGIMGKLKRVLTPVSIGPTIILIGLSLFGAPAAVGVPNCWWEALLVVALIVTLNQLIGRKFVKIQMFSVITSLVIAWIIAATLTVSGVLSGTACAVNFMTLQTVVEKAYYFRPPIPFPWGLPKIMPAFALGMVAAYLASMVESIGDYHSVARMSEAPPPTEDMISRGLGAEGLGCLIGGIFGAAGGYTSYSENIGSIGLTRVSSRYVFQVGGILILFLGGMITIWGAFMASMPGPIVGGLYLTVFGLIAAVGVSVVSMADMKSSRNLFIIGIAMFAGLAIPNMAGSMDPWLQSLPLSIRWAGDILKVIAETGMAVTAFIAIFLDNIIPGTPEERGITHPEWAGE